MAKRETASACQISSQVETVLPLLKLPPSRPSFRLAKCYAIASSDYGIAFGVAVCFSSFGSCDAAAGTHYFAGRLRWQKERPHLLGKGCAGH